MRFLITGGAGFIGSGLVRHLIWRTGHEVLVVDKLTYAGGLASLAGVEADSRFSFAREDICNERAMGALFNTFQPDVVIHLAAESHVDRSIDAPDLFLQTNVMGTGALLNAALGYWRGLPQDRRASFRFHHVSTDEVFGSLGAEGLFTETTSYDPRSPYSASKAGSDHLVRAWGHTYGLPIIITNCSNNYGPYQFPEKLIPLTILNGLERRPLPVYGSGENVRDWLFVDDHVAALLCVALNGRIGDTYCIGGFSERRNIDVVREICSLLDKVAPDRDSGPRERLIRFVADRPGHDQRYAIDASKICRELGWRPRESFESGLEKTVRWYIDNRSWWESLRSGVYAGERLGMTVG